MTSEGTFSPVLMFTDTYNACYLPVTVLVTSKVGKYYTPTDCRDDATPLTRNISPQANEQLNAYNSRLLRKHFNNG